MLEVLLARLGTKRDEFLMSIKEDAGVRLACVLTTRLLAEDFICGSCS